MPEPTFLERLKAAAMKVPGLRPASLNNEPTSETTLRVARASNDAGKSIRESIGPEKADQIAAAVQNLRMKKSEQYQDHWAPVSMYSDDHAKTTIPFISPMVREYMQSHRPAEQGQVPVQPPTQAMMAPSPNWDHRIGGSPIYGDVIGLSAEELDDGDADDAKHPVDEDYEKTTSRRYRRWEKSLDNE